jgi:site-specific DNA recombinase
MVEVVAIYTRVSKEDLFEPASTRRQEKARRRFAASRSWELSDVLEDVDVSAYARDVRRPAFEDLMKLVAGGRVDGVVVWKLDRLVRRAADFERFWSRCERAGTFLASATEPIDSTTDMGLAVIRILVTFANAEAASMGLRLRARWEEKARAGEPICRGRMFGLNETWSEIVEDEAAAIREAADEVIAGASLRSIALDWNLRGIRPPRGGPWDTTKIRYLLRSPRLLGHNTLRGEVMKPDCFPAILDRLTGAPCTPSSPTRDASTKGQSRTCCRASFVAVGATTCSMGTAALRPEQSTETQVRVPTGIQRLQRDLHRC